MCAAIGYDPAQILSDMYRQKHVSPPWHHHHHCHGQYKLMPVMVKKKMTMLMVISDDERVITDRSLSNTTNS